MESVLPNGDAHCCYSHLDGSTLACHSFAIPSSCIVSSIDRPLFPFSCSRRCCQGTTVVVQPIPRLLTFSPLNDIFVASFRTRRQCLTFCLSIARVVIFRTGLETFKLKGKSRSDKRQSLLEHPLLGKGHLPYLRFF